MELKVWVDGIQRVVCGANYSTTCQDVVLALAHAMGRTGRFTLVEKWRETERPLTPGECPLQALQKWGEYAGEVRFFLVQAETEKARQRSSQGSQVPGKAAEKMAKFTHNFSPTPQPRPSTVQSVSSPSSDAIKRSSTFSGAHSPNYTAHHPPSSSSSSLLSMKNQPKPQQQQPLQNPGYFPHRPTTTSQHQYQNNLQTLPEHVPSSKQRSSSQSRQQQRQQQQQQQHYQNQPRSTATLPSSFHSRHRMQNGDVTSTLSSTSSTNSSPRSPSQSVARVNPPQGGHAEPKTNAPPDSHFADSRHSHPAQLPRSPDGRSDRSLDRDHQRGRPMATSQSQQRSQQQFHPTPSQPPPSSQPSSSSTYPTPAPRGQRHRTSPASPTSQQYENLPPVRPSRSALPSGQKNTLPAGQNTLPPGQSLSTFQAPKPRRSSSSGRRSSVEDQSRQRNNSNNNGNDFYNNNNNATNTHFPLPANVPSGQPDLSHRDAPEGHSDSVSSRTNHRRDTANLLGDSHSGGFKTFGRSEDPPLQLHNKAAKANIHSRDFQNSDSVEDFPAGNTNGRLFSGDSLHPQVSQGVPVRSVGQKRLETESAVEAAPSSNTLERNRRSQGDKVSFVESAFLRQQRSSRDIQNVSSSSPRQQNPAQDERSPRGDFSPNRFPQPYPDSPFQGQNGFQTSPRATASSHQPVLPTPTSPLAHGQDPASGVSVPQPNGTNILSSPRRHSAFKEVSPRSSRPNSSSSPAGDLDGAMPPPPSLPSSLPPVAYNLDEQNFNHYGELQPRFPGAAQDSLAAHSRQASLEIEEYDLDQNFPDVFPKESSFPGHRSVSSQNPQSNQAHMEYVMDRPAGNSTSDLEPEYMHLLRKVNMQQERIKMMLAQTNEIETEIDALEDEESNLNVKLDIVMSELESLESKEESYHLELTDLERVEWVDVVDSEIKCEQDLKKQMMSLKDGLSKMEIQYEEMKKQEAKQMEEINQEEKKLGQEKEKAKKEEEEIKGEIAKVEKALSECDELMAKRKGELSDLLTQIADIEKHLMSQDAEATKIESELHFENLKDFQAHPVPKETGPSPTSDLTELIDTPPATPVASDTGEAILKILEEGRSPRMSPAMIDENGGLSAAQHIYKSALATKNPNGVWV